MFDYKALAGHVWYFNIMGYDFSGEHSAYPGSVAPINALTNQPSLETAVNDFLNLEISGQQIILSLPLYGVTWDVTKSGKWRWRSLRKLLAVLYDTVKIRTLYTIHFTMR